MEQRPVDLHHSENVSRAESEEQRAIGRFQRAHDLPGRNAILG